MNFKKKVSGSWTDVPHYISGTDTETITTLPATIYPLAQSVTIGLKGNTVQNGTPTPSAPVPVVGVGDLDNGQYKIPISSAGQTTPVYLGEVQTTRKIKKLVLDGTEDWETQSGQTLDYFRIRNMPALPSKVFCTHYISPDTDITYASIAKGIKMQQSSQYGVILACRPPDITNLNDFKTFLQQQYAAGTPVCVWYVLATEETAVVNEPIMKIGDYADSISSISIPTTAGANMLDVDTTVKPSEVTANFNGWHPVTSAHERSGGAWT